MKMKCGFKPLFYAPLVLVCAWLGLAPAARAVNLVQEFYLPMPEQQIYQANSAIISGTGSTIASTFSIVVTGSGTVIYYDQWEDGYETDLGNPAQPTTQIWGDGNDAHGIPPGFAHNPLGLPAGTVLTLTNNVALPRNPSTILWDARDRVAANKALIISRAGWPIPTGPVFAGAVSVLSTIDYGTNYISPVGQNLTNNLFKYVGMFIMAAQNNTTVRIDPNGTGVGATTIVLNQGESYLVNGGILKGGRVTSTKPIQADLFIGHVGASYASDWFTLYPASAWSSSYYTPVGSAASGSQPAYVYLYNPGVSAITINYNTKVGSGSLTVPGTNGVYQFQMPVGSGASFLSAGGQNFYALCTVAANNASDTSYNWGFTLVPQSALTTEATVGWGPGSADGTVNGSPVWVTALAGTKLYVDYKGDHAGPLAYTNGGIIQNYDTNFTVTALQAQKIFDPGKNQTGMRVFTVDGTLITAAWGEDPDTAQPGNPYIDAGTTVLPFPVPLVKKSAVIVTDTAPTGLSIGDVILYSVQVDNKGLLPLGNTVVIDAPSSNLTYVLNSTTVDSNSVPDSVAGTPFPLDAPGYTIPIILSQGTTTFRYRAQVNASGMVSNSVNIGGTTISAQTSIAPQPTNGASVTLNFSDTNGVTAGVYSVGANVFVTLTNAVGNTASNSVQSLNVTVIDTNTLDIQTITLTETGNNTGVFRNLTGLPTSAISGLGAQDGTLYVAPGDTLSVSYTEPTFGSTGSATATISIPTPNKQLYLTANGVSTNQLLNRVNPVAAAGHGTTYTSVDIGSGGGSGAITQTASNILSSGGAATLTITNVSVSAAGNALLLVAVSCDPSSVNNISSMKYGAQNMALVSRWRDGSGTGTATLSELWSLVGPTTGTTNVLITFTAAQGNTIAVASVFAGVNQLTPFSKTNSTDGTGTSITNIISSAVGEQVFSFFTSRSGTAATVSGASQVKIWGNVQANTYSAGSLAPGIAGSVTNRWTGVTGGAQWNSIAVSIKPAAGGGGGGPATNVTSFAQTPVFASAFTMPVGGLVTITNFITITNGTLASGAAVTATLRTNGVNFLTLTNPVYTAAGGATNLVWTGTLANSVTIPAGAAISYVISNNVANSAFHVNYDSTNAPSVIVLPASTVIQVTSFGVFDAPFPGGNLVGTPTAGDTVYIRSAVSDPFGSYDITSLGLVVTGPNPAASFTNILTGANVVATNSSSKTYEYQWVTGPTTGGYNIAVTAREGTEGVTATAAASITTTFQDLGTPSATEFTGSPNGIGTNSYTANGPVSVRVTDLNRNTNATTIDTIIVIVTSSSGDSEVLTLIETGVNTGIFTNSISASATVAGSPNNGSLYAPVGSILTASYSDPTDPTDNTSATATVQPAPGIPGVSLSKTILSPSGGQVGINQPVTYNLQVVNTGSTVLTNVIVTDNFPSAKLTYSTASLAPNVIGSGVLTWNTLGAFAPGQSTNLTVTFLTTSLTGTLTNSATVNGGTATNTSAVTLLVNQAALNVVKTLVSPTNTPVAVGSNVVFRITVQNVGNTVVNYLPLEDTFSGAYYQFVSSTISNNGSGAGSLIWTNLAYPLGLATNAIITNDVTMKVIGQGNPANNTATVDFASDLFGNPVPASSSTIGVATAAGSITGHVYNDVDTNGVFSAGDLPLAGVTLQLYTDPNGDGNPGDGALVQITTTDGSGYYEFLNLNIGHHVIVENHLAGFDSSSSSSNQRAINLPTLTATNNVNFFDYQPPANIYSTINGVVWSDTNGNGTNNVGETNIVNVSIQLFEDVNTNGQADLGEPLMGSATTDATGNYTFFGITPGHYVIRESDPFGYYSTGDSQGTNDNQITFVSTNGIVSTNNNFFDRLSPVAVNDTNSTMYFTSVMIDPLTNDLSPNGDALTISNATTSGGILAINPGSTNLTFTPTNIGPVTITYTIIDAHGGSSTALITVDVSPAPLTITANSTGKTYGQTVTFVGTEFTAVGLTNGNSVSSVTLNSAGATNTANVGSYPIIPSAAVGNGLANYAITYATNGTLTVTQASLGITANATNRYYGKTNPVFTYAASGFVNGDTASVLSGAPSLTTVAVTNSPVGTYPIVATNGTLSAMNYAFSFTNGVLTVNLAAPLVTWPVPTNIVYGTPLGTNQNNASSPVPGTYVYNPTNGVVPGVGTNLLAVVYTPGDTNYGPTNLSVSLVVTPASLTVTASNVSRVYGQPNPVLSGTLVGVVNGDNITAIYSTTAVTNSAAGSYPIVPVLVDPSSRLVNYAVTTNNGTLSVSKAVLGITANLTNRVYGVTNPVFTYTATGFANGDTAAVLSGSPSLTTLAVTNSPVGTYSIVATNGTLSATNYSFNFTNGTLTVALGGYGITWTNPTSITYGTLLGTNQNNATATVPGSFVYSPTNGVLLPAGTNLLNVVFTPGNTNYAITNASVSLVVTPAPLSITASNQVKIYGQVLSLGTAAFTSSGLVNGETIGGVTLTSAGVITNAGAGAYAIVPSTATGGTFNPANYSLTYSNGTLTVNPATLTVTANSTNKIYGAANPAFTANYGGFVNGDTTGVLSGSPSLITAATTNSGAGTYPISATSGTLSAANYSFSFVSGTLTVGQATLTVTANSTNKIYGATNPVFTASYGGFVNGDTAAVLSGSPSLTTTATTNTGAGGYPITATNGTLSAANYAFSFVNGTLTVNPATLTVAANSTNKIYGAANPAFTASYSGFVNGETASVLTGSPSLITAATTNSSAGGYPIVATNGTLSSANYAFSFVNGTLTIGQATLTVTASSTNKIYGAVNPAFTANFSGFVNGDTAAALTGSPGLTTTATTNSGAGVYPIAVTNGTLSAANYAFTFVNGTLTVNQATLTVTANNTNKVYGAANPTFTASYSGFVNGETAGVLAGSPSLTTVATTNSGAGGYPITATNGTLSAANYAFTFVNGTLTINQAALTVTANNTNKIYGAVNPSFTANYSGFVNGDTVSVLAGLPSLTSAATTNSGTGTYPIAATNGTLTAANYSFNFVNGTLSIGQATLIVSANSTNKIYGAANPVFTPSYSGFVNGETPGVLTGSPSLTTTAGTNSGVGGYTITATNGTLSAANYAFTFVNGTLTVSQATLTVTANDTNRHYNTANPTFTASYNGFANGETTSVLSGSPGLTTTALLSSPAGSYPITATNGTLSSANYGFSFVSGALTVVGGNYGITWTNPASIVYGTLLGTNHNNASATVAGNYTYSPTNGALLPAGTNTLTVLFAPGDTNYGSTNVSVQLIVTPAPLTITASSTNKVYNTTLTPGTSAFTSVGLVNSETIGGVTLSSGGMLASAPIGIYPITPSNATGGTFNPVNYSLTYSNGTLTVLGAGYTATWPTPTNIVYGTALGTNQNNASASIPGTFAYDPTNGVVLPAGTNTLTVLFAPSDTNYASTNLSVFLVVTPAPLSITANSTNKVYNTTLTLGTTAFTSSGLVNGDTVTNVTVASPGTIASAPVGTYPIIPSAAVGSGLTNYNIGYSNGTLTVLNGGYAITWINPVSIVYGTPLSTNQNNASATVAGGYVYNPTNGTILTVGTNNLSVAFTPVDTNYVATNLTVKLVVTPAPLSITASNATRFYGQPNPTFGGTLTGIQNGDNITAAYSTAAVTNSPVGSYPIIPTLSDPNSRLVNYNVTTNNGTLTIGQAKITVTASNTNKIYGAANPTFSASYTGFVNGETTGVLTGSPSLTTTAGTNSGVGGYPITATNGTLSAANYVFSFVNGTLTVNQATLTVSANSTNRLYNTANPNFTTSYAGFVNGDTTSVLTGSPILTTTAILSSPAGSYPIMAANGTLSAANYTFAFTNGNLTIIGGNYGITWPTPTNIVYGTALSTNQNNAMASVVGNYTYNPTNGTLLPAGTNTLTVLFAPSDTNYASTNLSVQLVVTPAPLTIMANSTNKVYNMTLTLGTTAFTSSGLVNGDIVSNVTLTSTGTIASAPVATYPIIPSAAVGSGLTNYSISYSNGTLAVLSGSYGITWTNPVSIVYGTPLSTNQNNATATVPGGYVYNPTNGTVLSVGTNNLSAVFTPGDTNYVATNLTVKLVVTPAPLSITASNATRLYGQSNPTFGGNINGIQNGDNITATYATSATTNSPVGNYPIIPTLSDPNSRLVNYTVTTNNGTLTIGQATLTVTANNTNKVYGATNPAFSASYTGFVNGETTGVLTGSPSLTTTATTNSGVGGYPITATNGTLSAANYAFNFVNGTLTINPAALTVTANNTNKIYGATNPTFTASYAGFMNGDTTGVLSGSPSLTTTATTNSGAGTYLIAATNGTLSAANYSFNFVNGILTIGQATLTVTANNTNKIYGATNPAFTASYSGFVNGETPGVLTGSPSLTTTATTNSSVGSYVIAATNGTLSAANYAFTFANGTLTINQAALTVTANNTNKIFGAANPAFTASYSGFVNAETAGILSGSPSLTTTATTNSGAGGYPITATNGTLSASNYAISFVNGTLTVGQATLNVTVNSTNRLYNTANPTFTASYSGFMNGDTASVLTGSPSLNTTAILSSPAGTYPITATNGTLSAANYAFAFVNGSLTIIGGSYAIAWTNPASIVYGTPLGTNQNNANATVGGSYTYNPTNGTVLPAGTNALSVLFTPSDTNFAGTNLSVLLVVTPAPLTITANSTNKVYNTTLILGTTAFTSSGLVNGDTISNVTLASTGTIASAPVGTYPIIPSTAVGSGLTNYNIGYSNGTLTVLNGNYGITWTNPVNIVYGTPLSTNQNNVTATVLGGYVYNPTNGTVLSVGTNNLSVVFTPTDTNYVATNLTVKLVVTPAPLSITASNATRLYGQPNPNLSGNITGVVNGDNITASYATVATTNSPVGAYAIVPSLVDPNGRLVNYNVTTNNGTLTVSPAGLTITANNTNRLYGAVNPAFTYTASGFVNGDTASILSGAPSLTTTATTNSGAGGYPIVITNGTLSATNYAFTFVNGTLTVGKATLTVTADSTNRIYGAGNPAFTASFTGFLNGESTGVLSGAPSLATTASTNSGVGAYTIFATNGTLSAANYAFTFATGILTVGQAMLAVTANSTNKVYGAGNPAFTYAASGFVNGDTASVLSGAPSLTTVAVTNSPVGTYPIVATNGTLSAMNYAFSFTNGVLTVNLAAPLVTWPVPTNIVYGTPLGTNQNNASSPVPGTYVYNPTNGVVPGVGTNLLAVVYTPGDTNYGPTNLSVSLVVTPASLTVTASNVSRVYGQPNPVLSGTLVGVVNGDNITAIYSTTAVTNSPAGSYPIVPVLVDPNSRLVNYTVVTNNGTLTITNTALPTVDIAVFKTGPASGVAGSNLTYTITVTNLGPSAATNIVVSDLLPAGFTFVSAVPSTATVSNNLVSWTGFSLANNAKSNFIVTAVSAEGGNYTNLAFGNALGAIDSNPTNNNGAATNSQVQTLVSPRADVAIFKVGTTNIYAGATVTYTITATNSGPSTATNVVVKDNLPGNVTFQSASGGGVIASNLITWPSLILAKGATTSFTVVVTAPGSGSFTNIAFSTSGTTDPNPTNNNGSTGTAKVRTTISPMADVIVLLAGPTNVSVGDSFNYIITVTNGGPSAASGVVLRDNLPASLTFLAASGGGVLSNNIITWPTLGSLANGATTNFSFTVKAPGLGQFTNVASAASSTSDPNPTNNDGTLPSAKVQTIVASAQFGLLAGAPVLNPQTGLFEESVIVTNIGSTTVAGIRLYVGGLRTGVTLYNAAGTTNGTPYVQYNSPVNPGNTVTFALEFYDSNRLAFTHTLTAVAILPPNSVVAGTNGVSIAQGFMDTRLAGNNRFVIEFGTTPGKTYTVIYSDDLATWKVATPSVTANASITQWYDDGPPKTDSKPSSVSSRYYRVIKN